MHPSIASKTSALPALCRAFGVQRLELFGSATGDDFDENRSDVDVLVVFDKSHITHDPWRQYFGLKEALETLFGRSVDVVEDGALRNPFIRAEVERTKEPLYAA
jgi:uncharacterized protein